MSYRVTDSNYLNRCETHSMTFSLSLLPKMADRIKLFQFLQKYNRAMGIDSVEQSNDICFLINWKKFIFLAAEVQYTAALMAFMFFEAKTIFQYGTIFFGIASSIFSIVAHLIYSRQMKNFSKFNENCEKFIEKRKQNRCNSYNCLAWDGTLIDFFHKFHCL